MRERGEDHQRRRYPTVVSLFIEIAVVHSSILLAWRFLLPYMPQYLTNSQPLLDIIWTHILEPYAVSLFSIPSVVVLLIMLCYTAAKYNFAKDIFNVEAEPLSKFVMEFTKQDKISMQEIEELRYRLYSRGVLNPDEIDILNGLNQPTVSNRYEQVYHLLNFLNQKSNGPIQLIEVLQEMASEQNNLGQIADILMAEYYDAYATTSIRNPNFLCTHAPPGIDTCTTEVFTINSSKLEKIEWTGCGLVLNIPEDAITKEGRTVQLQLMLGFTWQIHLPFEGQHLLSPLYCVSIRGGKLIKPIKAEVQHCGELNSGQDGIMLAFLTADASKCADMPYKMMIQHKSTSFSPMSSSGTIDLHELLVKNANPSVIFAVCSQCRDVLSRHSVRIFYKKHSPHSSRYFTAHITLTKDLKICSKLLDEVYPASEWNSEPTEAVIVCLKDSFTISLMEGERVGGWKISPTSSLSLSKDYLDSIKIYGIKRIPHISLQLAWVGSYNVYDPVLTYGLTVDGTTEPHECTSLHLKLPYFHQSTGNPTRRTFGHMLSQTTDTSYM